MKTNKTLGFSKRILVFSADPGGAECLVPVLKALPEEIAVVLMCKAKAVKIFEKDFDPLLVVNDLSFPQIEDILESYIISAVLTSASSLPEKDMTEKLLWQWAKRKQLPSIAVLDHWQNYARRFSGTHEREYLAYLPDKIAIMDEIAKNSMIQEGFSESRLVITGQPALESLVTDRAPGKDDFSSKRESRKSGEYIRLTFFSQPIHDFFGSALGYDEKSALNDIITTVLELKERLGRKITLLCKLHPKNRVEDFFLSGHEHEINFSFIGSEYSNNELMNNSDVVIGMNSIMLIHSILAGVPTICYEPTEKRELSQFMPVMINAIPCIRSKGELSALLYKLSIDSKSLQEYLARQKRCGTHQGASIKIVALLGSMLNLNAKCS